MNPEETIKLAIEYFCTALKINHARTCPQCNPSWIKIIDHVYSELFEEEIKNEP